MEVVDPFVPSFQPDGAGFPEVPEQWASPFGELQSTPASEPENGAPAAESAPFGSDVLEPAVAPFGADVLATASAPAAPAGDANERAKQLTDDLAGTVEKLRQNLDSQSFERHQWTEERAQMQERIRGLEQDAARKEAFKHALLTGPGAAVSNEDLASLQSMTDALTQDPDRLTVLFNVVQQASKLGTVVTVFNQVRRMAEDS